MRKLTTPVHWWDSLPEAGAKPTSVLDWERAAREAVTALNLAACKLDACKQLEFQVKADAARNWTAGEIDKAVTEAYLNLPHEFRDSMS